MKSTHRLVGRGGFTLIEILVSLILLALITAAVFPVVTQQVAKGDPTRATDDLASIRSAIEQFRLDVRPSTPGDLEDLVFRPSTTGDLQIDATSTYSETQSTRWNGPYADFSATEATTATGDLIETGFGGRIQADLVCVTSGIATGTCAAGSFVAVQITDLTVTQFESLNDVIDGTLETDGAKAGQSQVSGKLRCDASGTACTTTYYLASPYRGS